MKAFIVYCHSSEDSSTKAVCDVLINGVMDSGSEYMRMCTSEVEHDEMR